MNLEAAKTEDNYALICSLVSMFLLSVAYVNSTLIHAPKIKAMKEYPFLVVIEVWILIIVAELVT